jgi:hypothetical protein
MVYKNVRDFTYSTARRIGSQGLAAFSSENIHASGSATSLLETQCHYCLCKKKCQEVYSSFKCAVYLASKQASKLRTGKDVETNQPFGNVNYVVDGGSLLGNYKQRMKYFIF